ncbi:anti-sigma factor [Evansella clarkii]|uniref:anti-sigma factor n=1 Tax=Evansella clarkii TaxID=79879 RepID=UPI000B44EC6C|nr:anti-sigma factor [Evansella clarkii]
MSDEFKRKLEAYEKGELSEGEAEEFEKELEKLEKFNEFLEEKESDMNGTVNSIDNQKQQKILKRGKWRARFTTAVTALLLVLVFTIISAILTSVYYAWGSPDRTNVYRNVIDHTMTITDPHGWLGGTSTNTKFFFGMEATRDINKRVGHETIKTGEMEVDFLFSMMSYPERRYTGPDSQSSAIFFYPGMAEGNESEWRKLEELHEGTVVSAYLSFSELMDTETVLQLFGGRNMDVNWLAVDTGLEGTDEWYEGVILDPIGFPAFPIWHDDDMIQDFYEEERGLFGSKIVSEGYPSPDYSSEDQGTVLQDQFLKTLEFLSEHERKADQVYRYRLNLEDRIAFLESEGIWHYGVVVTGPTKEVLQLQNEEWAGSIEVEEVAFWNWESF